MGKDQAKAFRDYLRDKSDERGGLQNAVVEEIVSAGAQAGFTFTVEDLHEALEHGVEPGIFGWKPNPGK